MVSNNTGVLFFSIMLSCAPAMVAQPVPVPPLREIPPSEVRSVLGMDPRPPAISASDAYAIGLKAYKRGDLETAVVFFGEAADRSRDVSILFNLASTHYRLQNYSLARLYYRRFTRHAVAEGRLPRQITEWPRHASELADKILAGACACDPMGATSDETYSHWDAGALWPLPGVW